MKRIYCKILNLVILLTLVSSSIPFVAALDVTADKSTYDQGDTITITVSGGTVNGDLMLQIESSSGKVWADQVDLDVSGEATYTLKIPSSWANGPYTIKVKDVDTGDGDSRSYRIGARVTSPYSPPTSPPLTAEEIAEMPPDEAAEAIEELNTSYAASIIDKLDDETAAAIFEWLEVGTVADIVEALSTETAAGILEEVETETAVEIIEEASAETAAEILNEMDEEAAADILLGMDTAAGAEVVESMAEEDLSSAAERVEAAVKRLISELDETRKAEITQQLKDTLENVSVEALVDLFIAISSLPATPSTVAEVFEIIDLAKTLDVVSAWITVGELDELADVFSYLTAETLGDIYLGMPEAGRITLYPHLSTETVAALPSLGEFEFSSLTISPAEVDPGDPVTIRVTITNIGAGIDSYTVSLKIDGVTEDTATGSLAADASETLTFTVSETTPGTYTVDVEGETGSFQVKTPPAPPAPAEFETSGLSLSPSEVEPGEDVTVSVTVENVGEESGTHTVEVELDGAVVDSDSVTLSGEASKSLSFQVSSEEEGSHTVEVDELSASFTVAKPPARFPLIYIAAAVLIVAGIAVYFLYQKQA